MNLKCQSCGAALIVEEHLRTADCPFCGSPSVIARPPSAERPAPDLALGFELPLTEAHARVREWLGRRTLFARTGFKKAALEKIRGVYTPAWLFSAMAESSYSASIGENYTETERYTTTENGKTVTKTRTVTRTEWRPLSGRCSEYVADLLVTASNGLANQDLERIEPFDLRRLRRYQPALISGWIAEEPTVTEAEGLRLAHDEALRVAGGRLKELMPGDTHRGLEYDTRLSNEAIQPCLVPVWVMAARYHPEQPPVRILINGQTGKVFGKVPLSWPKIVAAVVAGAGILAAIVWLLGRT